ncbi:DUF1642 domain-containing protein [Streptococcus jiangjianxini]|uniref:DUF1642 domain-containing protein n=1 Tax=Streptococcus jiangjianxini TaxID=3161189 RepID=UPI0032EF599D
MTEFKKGDTVWVKAVVKKEMYSEGDLWVNEYGFETNEFVANVENVARHNQEKPVLVLPEIPRELANWIKKVKHDYAIGSVVEAFDAILFDISEGILSKSIDEWYNFEGEIAGTYPNQEVFAIAWIYGYTFEKEKLYTVQIPDPNSKNTITYLSREDGEIVINGIFYYDCLPDNEWKDDEDAQLTEAEIKKDFDWAWQFAKPVEVDNEN